MKRSYFAGMALVAAAALTACGGGGGGDDKPADAIDKYVGAWSNCFPESGASVRLTATFTKTSATAGNYTLAAVGYPSANCTGTSAASASDTGTAVLQGTKAIGAETVDKVLFTSTTDGPEKQVAVIRNQQLVLGLSADDGGAVDAEGYPTTLDNVALLKQ